MSDNSRKLQIKQEIRLATAQTNRSESEVRKRTLWKEAKMFVNKFHTEYRRQYARKTLFKIHEHSEINIPYTPNLLFAML